MKIGLVGAGGIAQTWAAALQRSAGTPLVAVCDVRPDAARTLAEPAGAIACADIAELVDRSVAEAVVVCTPPDTHRAIAEAAAAAGLHVLCEKPLAVSGADAAAMLAAAERTGVVLTMASKFRFVEDMVRAKSMIAAGALGEPLLFTNAFASRVSMAGRWNADPARSGGGVLIDNGTHSVDIARYLLGPLAGVHVVEGPRLDGLAVEESVHVALRLASGAVGSVALSWAAANHSDHYVEVLGTEGVVRIGWSASAVRRSSSPAWEAFGSGYDKVAVHERQLDVFAAAVAGTGELLIDAGDALASVAAIEAGYRSLASGRFEPLVAIG